MLAAELMERLSKGHGHLDPDREWIAEHQRQYDAVRLRWGIPSPCQATKMSPWLPTLTPSQQSILVLHQHRLLMSKPLSRSSSTASGQDAPTIIPRLMVDVHPSISRMSTSILDEVHGEVSPCILPGQLLWLHLKEPRPMLGWEAMLFQGWPIAKVSVPEFVTDKMLQDLAGNGVSLPVLLALVISLLMSLSFEHPCTEEEDATTQHEADEALRLLGLMTEGD